MEEMQDGRAIGDPDYEQLLDRLAPCGLDCHRCVMSADGVIKRSAEELMAALEGFEKMAARATERVPAFAGYQQFSEILAVFAEASCTGCRRGGATFPFCAARTCYKEQGVDFCFQCNEYPCDRNSYPENFAERWRTNNDRMRELGVHEYYCRSLQEPRYR